MPTPTTPPSTRRAFSVDEYAKAIGISRGNAWNLIREGHLRTVKLGQRTLILAAEAERFERSLPDARAAA